MASTNSMGLLTAASLPSFTTGVLLPPILEGVSITARSWQDAVYVAHSVPGLQCSWPSISVMGRNVDSYTVMLSVASGSGQSPSSSPGSVGGSSEGNGSNGGDDDGCKKTKGGNMPNVFPAEGNGNESMGNVAELRIEENCPSEEVRKLHENLLEYEREFCPPEFTEPINYNFLVKNGKNELVGGVNFYISFGTSYVKDIWVREDCRGQGIAAGLMKNVEDFSRKNGAVYVRGRGVFHNPITSCLILQVDRFSRTALI